MRTTEKENLHPGDHEGRMRQPEDMDTGHVATMMEDDNQAERLSLSMDRSSVTSAPAVLR